MPHKQLCTHLAFVSAPPHRYIPKYRQEDHTTTTNNISQSIIKQCSLAPVPSFPLSIHKKLHNDVLSAVKEKVRMWRNALGRSRAPRCCVGGQLILQKTWVGGCVVRRGAQR